MVQRHELWITCDSEQRYEQALTGKEYSEKCKAEMERRVGDAWSELQRVFDVGSLIISEEATVYPKEKLKPRYEDWEKDSPVDFWKKEEKIAQEVIAEIKIIARRELER